MAKERLIGSDGKLVTVTFGTVLDSTDSPIDTDGWYQVEDIGVASDLPAGLSVGELVYLVDGDTLAAGDEVAPLVEREQADVTSFNLEISKAEIDVTTLADGVRRYRTGKVDMNGSLEGITTLGETDAEGWVLNNFIKIVQQTATGTVSVFEVDDSPIYLKGYIQKDDSPGEKESFVWARVVLLGSSLGASGEDAQNFSSNFRIAPGEPEPTLYVREVADET